MKKGFIVILSLFLLCFLSGCNNSKEDSSTLQEPLTNELNLTPENVLISGRVSTAGGRIALEWSGTGVSLRFKGTGASLYLSTAEKNEIWYPYVRISVDDEKPKRLAVREVQWLELCRDLEYGEHLITLHKTTEAGAFPLFVTKVMLTGSDKNQPELLEPPKAPERRIEFIGDSITCGYGVLGSSSEYAFNTLQEDVFSTYAAYTAEHFKADAQYIAISGKGIVRDAGGFATENIPEYFHWTSKNDRSKWDHSKWVPDVVVINAGTNDQEHAKPNDFIDGAVNFLKDVRAQYPQAKIVWCYGMMNERMHDVIRQAVEKFNELQDGADAVYLPLESINNRIGETGAGTHPNERANKDRSQYLIQEIEKLTGWKGV